VEVIGGSFVSAALDYFLTKFLPPTPVEQVLVQVSLGTVVAGAKWYLFTPRRGLRGRRGF
jgi:hypothetical protein